MDEAKQIFVQEAQELLEQMEDALLSLEDAPEDAEHLNSVFRAAHTIKGSSGIFGFDDIVEFTHPVETVLDRVRSGEDELSPPFIAWLLECKDHIALLVEYIAVGEHEQLPDELASQGEALLDKVSSFSSCSGILATAEASDNTSTIENSSSEVGNHWLISLDFKKDAFRCGLDPMSFLRYLSGLGDIAEMVTVLNDSPDMEELDAEDCYLSFRIGFISEADKQSIADVFSFAEDDCDICIVPPDSKQQEYLDLLELVPELQLQPLGAMLIQVGALTRQELEYGLNLQKNSPLDDKASPIGEILVEQQSVHQHVVDKAVNKQEATRKSLTQESHAIRVDAKKLGQLIDLVGELVIASSSMRNQISRHHISDADEAASNMERLVEEIRDNALQLRMVPIGETFSRFKRVVRDVSKELGKEIEISITGGESELDKSVVEKLNDPLTHLVRNALDHGIELPQERLAVGKDAKGRVSLNAFHDSGNIVVEISDDGAGLNLEKVRQKAENIGLIRPEQILSRQELLQLIFEPGLSTKQEATNLSGRGVGMDVVKKNIEALRGSIDVESELGSGTKVSIRLPLTLAIIDGFLVGVGNESYIIPLTMVEECVEFGQSDWHTDPSNQFINLRGEALPFIRIRDFFSVSDSKKSSRESLVVVRFGRQRAALVVEELFGEQQTVIKPLGVVFQHLLGISGATLLGNGEVALILDIQGLVSIASSKLKEVGSLPSMNLLN